MSKALECTNSEGTQIPFDGISSGLLQSQEEAIYVNTAVKKKKKTQTQTQLVTLSFGKEQQWPYHPYVYGNTNYFI